MKASFPTGKENMRARFLKNMACSSKKNLERPEVSKDKGEKEQNEFIFVTTVQHSCMELIYIC